MFLQEVVAFHLVCCFKKHQTKAVADSNVVQIGNDKFSSRCYTHETSFTLL